MTVLPEILDCREFVNADEIAKGISPFNPEAVAIEAGRIMLQRVEFLLSRRQTFALETTLATRSYANLVKRAQEIGYQVILLFFWLPSPEMAIARVKARVAEGGHSIPEDVIERRYWLGLNNLFKIFIPLVDSWSLYCNQDILIPIVRFGKIEDKQMLSLIRESCQRKKN